MHGRRQYVRQLLPRARRPHKSPPRLLYFPIFESRPLLTLALASSALPCPHSIAEHAFTRSLARLAIQDCSIGLHQRMTKPRWLYPGFACLLRTTQDRAAKPVLYDVCCPAPVAVPSEIPRQPDYLHVGLSAMTK